MEYEISLKGLSKNDVISFNEEIKPLLNKGVKILVAKLEPEVELLFEKQYHRLNKALDKLADLEIPQYDEAESVREAISDLNNVSKVMQRLDDLISDVLNRRDEFHVAINAYTKPKKKK